MPDDAIKLPDFPQEKRPAVIVAGAGPAGLMAAERLGLAGCRVTVIDQMPSVGRKLLMAGRSGLNLTNAEPLPDLLARYGEAASWLAPMIEAFKPADVIAWAESLEQPCFTGSSGHVFPVAMKASPLLRAWLARLSELGVRIQTRTCFKAWDNRRAIIDMPEGTRELEADAIVLALGGASWPRLGADGHWTKLFPQTQVRSFRPANCGAIPDWPQARLAEFAGTPLKRIALRCDATETRGDLMIGAQSIEGAPLYHLVPAIRKALDRTGHCTLSLDLRPDLDVEDIAARLARTRPRESRSNRLRKALGLDRLGRALVSDATTDADPRALALAVKQIPLPIAGLAPLDRAISVAGGLRRDALTPDLMVCDRPGLFVCGEMLDWEAPTGGYLLQACLSTGFAAGNAAADWLARENRLPSGKPDGTSGRS
ncbi:TIGR03862 family flavoprotein [Tanticharoenia sakaeratensis]|uniref:TIGR03862 family flavoprotein n=1 Tax=Tanticharoenia sakaeratensis TaxID=444053 RepID=UPI0006620701|nr:TIGR03862 family flavoprotein [Tanticharoenia sakaeratensis]